MNAVLLVAIGLVFGLCVWSVKRNGYDRRLAIAPMTWLVGTALFVGLEDHLPVWGASMELVAGLDRGLLLGGVALIGALAVYLATLPRRGKETTDA